MKIKSWENIELNEKDYFIDYNENGIPILKITPEVKPKSLCKYYSLNENNVTALINNQVYSSEPDDLNDVFDTNLILLDYSDCNFDHVENLFKDVKKARIKFNENYKVFLDEVRENVYIRLISSLGILSLTDLTENKRTDLMWAHYTNNKGFLIEFNTEEFGINKFLGPFPINYIDKLEKIKMEKIDNNLGFLISSLVKKDIWKYENEYRYLCLPDIEGKFELKGNFSYANKGIDVQKRLVKYPKSAINKIVLGFNFFNNDQIEYENNFEYKVNLKENAPLKMYLLNNIINNKTIRIEIIRIDEIDLEFKYIPLEIKYMGGIEYHVKEIRNDKV